MTIFALQEKIQAAKQEHKNKLTQSASSAKSEDTRFDLVKFIKDNKLSLDLTTWLDPKFVFNSGIEEEEATEDELGLSMFAEIADAKDLNQRVLAFFAIV